MTTKADYEEVLKDHRRLVRELDEALSGPGNAAKQASLCDLIPQAKAMRVALKRLAQAVEAFGEAKYLDDEDEMDKSGIEVVKAIASAKKWIA